MRALEWLRFCGALCDQNGLPLRVSVCFERLEIVEYISESVLGGEVCAQLHEQTFGLWVEEVVSGNR